MTQEVIPYTLSCLPKYVHPPYIYSIYTIMSSNICTPPYIYSLYTTMSFNICKPPYIYSLHTIMSSNICNPHTYIPYTLSCLPLYVTPIHTFLIHYHVFKYMYTPNTHIPYTLPCLPIFVHRAGKGRRPWATTISPSVPHISFFLFRQPWTTTISPSVPPHLTLPGKTTFLNGSFRAFKVWFKKSTNQTFFQFYFRLIFCVLNS